MKKKPSNKPAGSIEVRIELMINAPQQRVWDALVNDARHWWPASFYTSERTKRFVLEPRLGGRMFEDFGSGEGLVWFTVNGIVTYLGRVELCEREDVNNDLSAVLKTTTSFQGQLPLGRMFTIEVGAPRGRTARLELLMTRQ